MARFSNFDGVNVTQKQTFGCCITCEVNTIKTIHIDCGHRCCCLECADKCRKCRAQGCTQSHPNHLRIYPGHLPINQPNTIGTENAQTLEESNRDRRESDGDKLSVQAQDIEHSTMRPDHRDDDTSNRILRNDRVVLPKKYAGDELYDSQAIHTLGDCIVCLGELIEYFLLGYDGEQISFRCGHGVCKNCYSKLEGQHRANQNGNYLFNCPLGCGEVQMVVEPQN